MAFQGFLAAPGLLCPPCRHDFASMSSVVICSCRAVRWSQWQAQNSVPVAERLHIRGLCHNG